MNSKQEFKVGERVVYPSHGVGEITAIEEHTVIGTSFQVYVISFPQDRLTLKVPVNRSKASGLRRLASAKDIEQVYDILQSKAKRGNKMWSRRAQEYEAKINSGEINAIAEVVRDLYKNVDHDRSYSERTIYEAALGRLAAEISVLDSITEGEAENKLVEILKEKLVAA